MYTHDPPRQSTNQSELPSSVQTQVLLPHGISSSQYQDAAVADFVATTARQTAKRHAIENFFIFFMIHLLQWNDWLIPLYAGGG
jgi:hypothetical protein